MTSLLLRQISLSNQNYFRCRSFAVERIINFFLCYILTTSSVLPVSSRLKTYICCSIILKAAAKKKKMNFCLSTQTFPYRPSNQLHSEEVFLKKTLCGKVKSSRSIHELSKNFLEQCIVIQSAGSHTLYEIKI